MERKHGRTDNLKQEDTELGEGSKGMDLPEKCKMCGTCCNYISVQLDEPEDHDDYDEICWFLMHKGTKVYLDDDEDWFLEVAVPCKAQSQDGSCLVYENRPTVCKEHDPDQCENNGEGSAYNILFTSVEDFKAYLRIKGIRYEPGKRD